MRTGYLLEREVGHVLAALTPSNRLVCRVCLHTGLRVGDVLALRTQQLAPHFWVVERKTGKRRQVGLPAGLLRDIKAQAGEVWAFPGRNPAKPRTRQAVWADVKRAAKAFRLVQNIVNSQLTHRPRLWYAGSVERRCQRDGYAADRSGLPHQAALHSTKRLFCWRAGRYRPRKFSP
ncbi:tyrosine-type recombinase/integrase [uncultured Flavonifractor sp.]|uniref:tyrosine-type recombinase/integrase n=1 Tax=uncultured Flavonifractor sp. TaxID=1193534 RepID=UPI00344A9384